MKFLINLIKPHALLLALGVLATGILLTMKVQRDRAIEQRNELALSAVNLLAINSELLVINDTLTARLLTQYEDTTAARVEVVARVDTVVVEAETQPVEVIEDDVRVVRFRGEQGPFAFRGVVTAPPPPAVGQYNLRIGLAPVSLALHVTCQESEFVDIANEARVTIRAPSWLRIDSISGNVEPVVCNSALVAPVRQAGELASWMWVPVGAAAGAATAYVSDGDVGAGAVIGMGTGVVMKLLWEVIR